MKQGREITKNILTGILLIGGIVLAGTSPYFVSKILPRIFKYAKYKYEKNKHRKSAAATFHRLMEAGYINVEQRGKQIYISLTEEGKKKAGKYQIDDLEIRKPKRWDKKWRILIFDISDKQKIKREALRGKIKELGMYQIQKSVWVYPYDFLEEMRILYHFFGFTEKEMKIITAEDISDDEIIKEYFRLV